MLTIKNIDMIIGERFTINNAQSEWVIDNVHQTNDVYEIFVNEWPTAVNNPYVFAISRDRFDADELEYGVVVYKDKKIVDTDSVMFEDIDDRLGMVVQIQTHLQGIKYKLI